MNPIRIRRWITRLGLPVLLVSVLLLWWSYGVLSIPAGMDTMPDVAPPGTVTLIQKRPGRVPVGAVVFVAAPGGGVVLTRVAEVLPDGAIVIRHDNRSSALRWLEDHNPYPADSVVGLVLTQFTAEPRDEPKR